MNEKLKLFINDVNVEFNNIALIFTGELTEDFGILVNPKIEMPVPRGYLVPSKYIKKFYNDYIATAPRHPREFFVSRAANAILKDATEWYSKF